jgi:hypothetical protein
MRSGCMRGSGLKLSNVAVIAPTAFWDYRHHIEPPIAGGREQVAADVSEDSEAHITNAEIVQWVESQWPEWEREGIGPGEESILNAAAVGLVEEVWRNSPLEDMHAGGGMRGRGPSDGAMFAESVALQRVANTVLPREYGLLEFEDHVLDRHRSWAAGGRTLQEMGYRYLGAFERHVRGRTNALLSLKRHGYRPALGYLVMRTRFYGTDHYGMPRWPGVAASVRELLLIPDHPAWLADDPERKRDEILAVAPTGTPLPDELYCLLIDGPDKLPLAVLDWLADRVMTRARSLEADRHHRGDAGSHPSAGVRSSAYPPVSELRFAVPPARRVAIYEDLISRLEASVRDQKGGDDDSEAYTAFLRGLLVEAKKQDATG